jgi:hypothetical protein
MRNTTILHNHASATVLETTKNTKNSIIYEMMEHTAFISSNIQHINNWYISTRKLMCSMSTYITAAATTTVKTYQSLTLFSKGRNK